MKRRNFRVSTRWLLAPLFAAGLYLTPLHASVPWKTSRVSMTLSQKDVVEALRELASVQNVSISISPRVHGVVSGNFNDVETTQFLNGIAEAAGLTWFYDGTKVYVESAEELKTRVLTMQHLATDQLEQAMQSVGYDSGPEGREVAIRAAERSGMFTLVGGPRFITATSVLARELEQQEADRVGQEMVVQVFRLRYASAQDLTVRAGSSTTIVPGVARALQNLTSSEAAPLSTGPLESARARSHEGLRGLGLQAIGNNNNNNALLGNGMAQPPAPAFSRGVAPSGAADPSKQTFVQADPRLNAVIVRDTAARMSLYTELVKMLDVPTKVIEITAAIVDIDTSNNHLFGTEFLGAVNTKAGPLRFGFEADRQFEGENQQGRVPSFIDSSDIVRGGGLNATALITQGSYEILARLKALQEKGAAQIVSSPSILTMENVEAIIRQNETVYVRVQGQEDVDLFDVTAGVQMRVTPTVVEGRGNRTFRLLLDIVDGSFVDQTVDNIPTTRESAINTQAVVPDNRTLLVGGYFVENHTRNIRQVPVLGKVPVLGYLFKRNEKVAERRQRFFFITPRVVNVPLEATPAQPVVEAKAVASDLVSGAREQTQVLDAHARDLLTLPWSADEVPDAPPAPPLVDKAAPVVETKTRTTTTVVAAPAKTGVVVAPAATVETVSTQTDKKRTVVRRQAPSTR